MKQYTSNYKPMKQTDYESGISGHGIVISILSAIICQMTIYTAMNISILDIPLMFTILLWCIFGGLVGLFMDYMGV